MAFGKDNKTLAAVDNFRQTQSAIRAPRPARTGGSGRGANYFGSMFHPSENQIDTIRVCKGEYLQTIIVPDGNDFKLDQIVVPYISFTEHFLKSANKSIICSAGPWANFRERRDPCEGCDIYWDTAERNTTTGRFDSNVISRQEKYAFSIFDYGTYHKVEALDRETGRVRIDQRTKQPYMNLHKCDGPGCQNCQARKEKQQGRATHWVVSYTAYQVLLHSNKLIGNACKTCGTENAFDTLGFLCPACESMEVDLRSSQLTMEEYKKFMDEPAKCSQCGMESMFTELADCRTCSPAGRIGKRSEIFDVDLRVSIAPTASGSKVLQVSGWTVRDIDPRFADAAKPVDLVERFKPTPLEDQRKLFGRQAAGRQPVTSASEPSTQYAVPYGRK